MTVTASLLMMIAMQGAPPISVQPPAPIAVDARDIATLLEDFVADYRNDPMAISATFGVKVGDAWWTVAVRRRQEAYARPNDRLTYHRFGPHGVTLTRGAPTQPTWYFDFANRDVLQAIASGEYNASTASMRSNYGERANLMTEAMPGFELDPGTQAIAYLVESHFWTKGIPEVTRFARDRSLPAHGASITALHSTKDVRVGWFSIGPNEAANETPGQESSQIPNMIIFTRGRGRFSSGEREFEVHEGMSIFVPPYVDHVIRNPYDQSLEGVVVLYGDNPEFAFGTSYIDFMQSLSEFYGSYRFRRPAPEPENRAE